MAPSVTRALHAIKRYGTDPEQLDRAILAAINVTLCLTSNGDDRVADGFNRDIASNGCGFVGCGVIRAMPHRPGRASYG